MGIGAVLRGGVLLAGTVILVGLARLLLAAPLPGEPSSVLDVIRQETHPVSIATIVDGVAEGRPTSLVRLGVLLLARLLVLTPVTRVALTAALF